MSAPPFARAVIMLRPAAFGFNPETAATNGFQRPPGPGDEAGELARAARREHDAMVRRLDAAGIEVTLWEDTPAPPKPDAAFLNNWVSTHPDGRVFLYPMATASRRRELRPELVRGLGERRRIAEVVDWSPHAGAGRFLEGTGSLVLDPAAGAVYACRSPRTDEGLVREWAALWGWTPRVFSAADRAGAAIYHTNVVLALGAGVSLCGLAAIDPRERPALVDALAARGPLIDLDPGQIDAFAGNMLQLADAGGSPQMVLSTTALAALQAGQRRTLEAATGLVPVAIPTIEAAGGGSARCLLAEDFLPRR